MSKNNYIFPDFMAQYMSKIDQRTQYEASMMSISLMSVGLVISAAYAAFYLDLALWFRITLVINMLFGLLFMWSYLVTTYQQYLSYQEAQELQEMMNDDANLNTVKFLDN